MVKKTLKNTELKETEVKEITYPSKKTKSTKKNSKPKEKNKQVESNYESEPHEDKKKEIKQFNENPNTKEYGVKLVNRKTYAGLWIFAIVLLLLFFINIVWGNSILSKIVDKNFEVNVDLGEMEINNSNENFYNHTTVNNNYNEYTIVNNNTMVFPDELLIKLDNSS